MLQGRFGLAYEEGGKTSLVTRTGGRTEGKPADFHPKMWKGEGLVTEQIAGSHNRGEISIIKRALGGLGHNGGPI